MDSFKWITDARVMLDRKSIGSYIIPLNIKRLALNRKDGGMF